MLYFTKTLYDGIDFDTCVCVGGGDYDTRKLVDDFRMWSPLNREWILRSCSI